MTQERYNISTSMCLDLLLTFETFMLTKRFRLHAFIHWSSHPSVLPCTLVPRCSSCVWMLPSFFSLHKWHFKYSQSHTHWALDIESFWTFIALKHNNHWLSQIYPTFHLYRKWWCLWKRHVWSGMKIHCDACHVCSPSPSGAHCFTYSSSGTDWLLFKQCWWAQAQSAPQWCSLW